MNRFAQAQACPGDLAETISNIKISRCLPEGGDASHGGSPASAFLFGPIVTVDATMERVKMTLTSDYPAHGWQDRYGSIAVPLRSGREPGRIESADSRKGIAIQRTEQLMNSEFNKMGI